MLLDSEKAKIRMWLGYPDLLRYRHTRLESILLDLSVEAEVIVRDCLDKLQTVEDAIMASGLTNAGLSRVDEIWFQKGASVLNGQRRVGRMYLSRLSIILGVPPYSDPFGTAGYLGDKFSGPPERGGGGFYNVG